MSARWLAVFALLLSGCALVTLSTKKRSWPDLDAQHVAGVGDRVAIHRDAYGIPHIRARTEVDGAFAMGFVHAQDRAFQADLNRRLAYGRVSEWLGERSAALDGFMKAMDFRGHAERQLREHASPHERALLVAYADGFNAGVASLGAPPVEYRLLGVDVEPWEAVDGLAQVYVMSWTLSDNPTQELAALLLGDRVDIDTLDALYRTHPDDAGIDLYWEGLRTVELGPFTEAFTGFSNALGAIPRAADAKHAEASNNWIVGPSKSADGMPIVANDPHLSQRVPSLWYSAELRAGPVHVAGATLPGSPSVIIGHNENIAWGLTNTMADVVDIAIVERSGDQGYVLAGQDKVLGHKRVEVQVRNGEPKVFEVATTEIGPVITELQGEHFAVLRWHAAELPDRSIAVFSGLNRAGSVSEALQAADLPMAVSQNLVVADTAGDFAWQVIGSVVRRRNHSGRVPYPASDPGFGWQGYLDRLPGERNPARGYVATANYRPHHHMSSAIGSSWAAGWRQKRLEEVLDASGDVTPADQRELQLDVDDMSARTRLPGLLEGVEPSTPEARQCAALLGEWDHRATPDSAGPAVWAAFQRELLRQALVDELGEDDFLLVLGSWSAGRHPLSTGNLDGFLQDRPAEVDRALHATCGVLSERLGPDATAWTWGALHQLSLKHPFGASSSLLSGWNMPDTPWLGTGNTVAAAGWSWRKGEYTVTGMQSLRIVMPIADLGASTLVYPGGQSGHPKHPQYADQFDLYAAGEVIPLWFHDDDVAANALHTVVLRPHSEGAVAGE